MSWERNEVITKAEWTELFHDTYCLDRHAAMMIALAQIDGYGTDWGYEREIDALSMANAVAAMQEMYP